MCEVSLQDWKDKLGKDPQKRADPKVFQHSELRELFGAYVHNLRGQIQQGYRTLMEQASNNVAQLLCSTKLPWVMCVKSCRAVESPFYMQVFNLSIFRCAWVTVLPRSFVC